MAHAYAGEDIAVKVEIAPSGRQHLAWAQRDWVYLESMAEITPMYDPEGSDKIRASLATGSAHLRRLTISTFVQYPTQDDTHFCVIPKHELYHDQTRIRSTLSQQITSLSATVSVSNSYRYRRLLGRVTAWKQDKGYGFVRQANGEPDAFLHISDVLNATHDCVADGANVEYEALPGPQRQKAVAVIILE